MTYDGLVYRMKVVSIGDGQAKVKILSAPDKYKSLRGKNTWVRIGGEGLDSFADKVEQDGTCIYDPDKFIAYLRSENPDTARSIDKIIEDAMGTYISEIAGSSEDAKTN